MFIQQELQILRYMPPYSGREEDDPLGGLPEDHELQSETEIIHQTISILAEHRPFGLTVSEIEDDIDASGVEDFVRTILDSLERNHIATVEDGYWSITEDDAVLANSNAEMLSSLIINASEWGEYEDEELDQLPGIGEQ